MPFQLPDIPPNWPRNALATTIVLTFVGALAGVLFGHLPEENEQVIDFLLGQLAGFVALILNFYFGSNERQSRSDERKQQ